MTNLRANKFMMRGWSFFREGNTYCATYGQAKVVNGKLEMTHEFELFAFTQKDLLEKVQNAEQKIKR